MVDTVHVHFLAGEQRFDEAERFGQPVDAGARPLVGHARHAEVICGHARAQPQLDASVTHRVNLGHGDRKDARQAKGHGCDERAQPYAGGLAGDAGQRDP